MFVFRLSGMDGCANFVVRFSARSVSVKSVWFQFSTARFGLWFKAVQFDFISVFVRFQLDSVSVRFFGSVSVRFWFSLGNLFVSCFGFCGAEDDVYIHQIKSAPFGGDDMID